MSKAPALFIGHGSPMNAIEDTPAARGWADIGARFPKPRAIVCVSAHWVTDGVRVMANAAPRTIHDFGRSFPQALFDISYPAPGEPALAQRIVAERLTYFTAQLDETWGLDHGAWSVLRRMYPEADVPVVQISLDARRTPREHARIGEALAPLREDGVLILGTGNIVHNLGAFFSGAAIQPWVQAFDDAITDRATRSDITTLSAYQDFADAATAAPDWEHFAPLFYTLGASADEAEDGHVFNRHYDPGISMTSLAFGLPT
jgi:4,5-DOPA dioxygenase extradiol